MTQQSHKNNEVRLENVTDTADTNAHVEEVNPDSEPLPHIHAKTYLTLCAVSVVYFAQLVNLVGSGAYRSAIAASVGHAQETTWIVATTVILVTFLGPPVSQAADYWGRRWFLLVPTFFGVVGSIIIARATSIGMAIAGETILSISYGAQPLLHAIASEVITRRNRTAAQAAINLGNGLGGIVGLLVGGAMTNSNPDGFRHFWYMTAGLYAFATITVLLVYTPPPRLTQIQLSFKEKLSRLDWVGYLLLGLGLVLWVLGLEWAENPYSWRDGKVLTPVITGAAFIIALGVYEWRFKADGMFHHGLFAKDRNFAIALVCIGIEGLVFFTANSFLSYQVAVLYEKNSLLVSLPFCIAFSAFIATSWGLALFTYKTKQIRYPIMFAFACFCAFNVCMSTTQLGSGRAVYGYSVILGVGLGVSLTALVTAAQLSAPPELIAITSGLMVSMRAFGGTVGLGVYTAIFHSKLNSGVTNLVTKVALPLGLPQSSVAALIRSLLAGQTKTLAEIPGVTALILEEAGHAYLQAFVEAVRGVWITAACFAAAAVVGSYFLLNPVEDLNLHIDAPVEKRLQRE